MEKEVGNTETVCFFSKIWWGLFIGAAILVSLVLLLVFFFPLGLSMTSDTYFGLNALISGIITDIVFRMILKKKMMISEKLNYSILFLWIPICLYIIVLQPFN